MAINIKFNQRLIDELKKLVPFRNLQLKLLKDLFSIGKEAAYRRLRGDVPFSFSEACAISNKLGISLDCIAHSITGDCNAVYKLITLPKELNFIANLNEYYMNLAYNENLLFWEKMKSKSSTEIICAHNTIPHSLLFTYPSLLRFRAFKWNYQMHRGNFDPDFSAITISKTMEQKMKDLSKNLNVCSEITLIFGRQIFISFIRQIHHFKQLGFLSDNDIEILRNELLSLISAIEHVATLGKSAEDKKAWIYLSNLDFETNYTHLKSEDMEISYMQIFQMHTISSCDKWACMMTKEWVESLKKYSTLISVSGEMERIIFFEEQRKAILAI
ncbi:MAG: hypothetical protein E6767_08325 [Dysgonomonas sp.]|nr:hypothetical protein [Dysgonomonas sp.]